jgi:membrane fusion protein (multidrug efflux system)
VRQVRGLYSAVDSGQADLAARQASVERARADSSVAKAWC